MPTLVDLAFDISRKGDNYARSVIDFQEVSDTYQRIVQREKQEAKNEKLAEMAVRQYRDLPPGPTANISMRNAQKNLQKAKKKVEQTIAERREIGTRYNQEYLVNLHFREDLTQARETYRSMLEQLVQQGRCTADQAQQALHNLGQHYPMEQHYPIPQLVYSPTSPVADPAPVLQAYRRSPGAAGVSEMDQEQVLASPNNHVADPSVPPAPQRSPGAASPDGGAPHVSTADAGGSSPRVQAMVFSQGTRSQTNLFV